MSPTPTLSATATRPLGIWGQCYFWCVSFFQVSSFGNLQSANKYFLTIIKSKKENLILLITKCLHLRNCAYWCIQSVISIVFIAYYWQNLPFSVELSPSLDISVSWKTCLSMSLCFMPHCIFCRLWITFLKISTRPVHLVSMTVKQPHCIFLLSIFLPLWKQLS